MKRNHKILTVATTIAAVAVPAMANAQGMFDSGNFSGIKLFSGNLTGLLNNIVSVALIFIGIIAVIYLIYGGVIYITAGGDADKAGKGRIAITNAIIGIIIVAASFIIYNTVANLGGGSDASDALNTDFQSGQ